MLWFLQRQNHPNGQGNHRTSPLLSTPVRSRWWHVKRPKAKTTTTQQCPATKIIGTSTTGSTSAGKYCWYKRSIHKSKSFPYTTFCPSVPCPLTRLDSDEYSFAPTAVNFYRNSPDSPATTGTTSSHSSGGEAKSVDDFPNHEPASTLDVSDSLCYSKSTATTRTAGAPHNDWSNDWSVLSFLNQSDEAIHHIMHDNENEPSTHTNNTVRIPRSRTFEYDYNMDYGIDDPHAEETVPATTDRTVPFTVVVGVAELVSFLDMSVCSVNPCDTSVLCTKKDPDGKRLPDIEPCRLTTENHPQGRPDPAGGNEDDHEYGNAYEEDDCSVTTAVSRALRVRPSITYDVSVLTMDPALYTNSRYVEC
jgi:hypothetical protein